MRGRNDLDSDEGPAPADGWVDRMKCRCDSTHVGLALVVKGWQARRSGACRRPALSGSTDEVSGDMMTDGVPGVRGAR